MEGLVNLRPLFFVIVVFICSLQVYAQTQPSDFVRASVDAEQVFVGQALRYTVQIFDAGQTEGRIYVPPTFQGFAQEAVSEITQRTELVDGYLYTVFSQDVRLYPLISGGLLIDSPRLLDASGQLLAVGELILVSVRDLPLVPEDFIGGIGEFSVATQLDKARLDQSDTALLSLVVSGVGNLSRLRPPLFLNDAFVVDYLGVEVQRDDFYVGRAVFRWSLAPLREGKFLLEPFSVSFFDSSSQAYYSRFTNFLEIEVAQVSSLFTSVVDFSNSLYEANGLDFTDNTDFSEVQGYINNNNYALATLALLRAQRLNPRNPEIALKLAEIQGQLQLRYPSNPNEPRLALGYNFHQFLRLEELSALVIGGIILSLGLFISKVAFKSLPMLIPTLTLIISLALGALYVSLWYIDFNLPQAVVIDSAPAYTGSDISYFKLQELAPATIVYQLETRGTWAKVWLPDQTPAWIEAQKLALVSQP